MLGLGGHCLSMIGILLETRLDSDNNMVERRLQQPHSRGLYMLGIGWTRCGRTFRPKLRAGHRIFTARLHRRRGLKRAGSRGCVLARGFARGAADGRRVPVRDDRVPGGWHVREFAPMAGARLVASPDRHQASILGLLATPIESCGLRPARRFPLPLLPVQREHVHRGRARLPRPAFGWMSMVRRSRLGGFRICDRRSGALRNVAGHASQVLRSRLASARGER